MIHFDRTEEPPGFDDQVRKRGKAWLAEHPQAKRPLDLWSGVKPQLADAFRQLCAYSAMYEPVGTVDHFVSVKADKSLAYEWSNYRFCSGWLNSSKQDAAVLDPFEVKDGWFEILLPSLQLVATHAVPQELRAMAEFTLERLRLRDDERVIRQRREWYRMYETGELSLDGLGLKAPLIARAVERQRQATT